MTLTIKSQDIFKDLKEVLESFSLKIENIDGAAAMVGRLHGLTKKLIDENKNLLSLKCIIHQEALCAKLGIKSGKAFSNEIMNWLTFSYLKAQQSTESCKAFFLLRFDKNTCKIEQVNSRWSSDYFWLIWENSQSKREFKCSYRGIPEQLFSIIYKSQFISYLRLLLKIEPIYRIAAAIVRRFDKRFEDFGRIKILITFQSDPASLDTPSMIQLCSLLNIDYQI